jgi:hypothetical protein
MVALMAGVLAGYWLAKVVPVHENILVSLFGLGGFSGTFIWLKKKGTKIESKDDYMPDITAKKAVSEAIPSPDLTCPAK